jgi:putative membrane protein
MTTKKDSGVFDNLRQIVLKWLITSLAIFAALYLVPGISFTGPGWQIGIIAAIFSVINLLIKPILTLITCPLVVLTLGLFSVVVNAILLQLTANFANFLGIQFVIDGFMTAFIGAIVISLTTLVLNLLSGEGNVRIEIRRGE